MPARRPPPPESSCNEWMVTFSDCMTLLLTFFVLLLSFSSFDTEAGGRLVGMFDGPPNPSVLATHRFAAESPVERTPTVGDRTEEGQEIPTFDRLDPTWQPRKPEPVRSADAYCDRRVLTIPSDVLFWGQGAQVTPQGKTILAEVAAYLRLVPSQVVVCETVAASSGPSIADAEDRALRRALALIRHLTEAERIEPGRFSISTAVGGPGSRAEVEPVVTLAILNPKVCP